MREGFPKQRQAISIVIVPVPRKAESESCAHEQGKGAAGTNSARNGGRSSGRLGAGIGEHYTALRISLDGFVLLTRKEFKGTGTAISGSCRFAS
jgi:hypothetical protein